MKNPKWTRDEIILTLDFYLSHFPQIPEKSSPELQELSDTLRILRKRLGLDVTGTYRNVNGVHMKLMNFHHFNPDYVGEGLKRGSKLDEEVFREFKNDPDRLSRISETIREVIENDDTDYSSDIDDDDQYEIQEGKLITRVHRTRERDRLIVNRKKERILKKKGRLECEGCGFDFRDTYGEYGEGFIECHHTRPVSEIVVGEKTSLDDLSLVCSNCHRMIHRHRPWLSMDQLRTLVKTRVLPMSNFQD